MNAVTAEAVPTVDDYHRSSALEIASMRFGMAMREAFDRRLEQVRSGAITVPENVERTATSAGSYGTPVTDE